MDKYIILTDSCIDLTDQMAKDLGLEVIPLSVTIEGKEYRNFLDGRDISSIKFYDLLREKVVPVTSQVNPNTFLEVMEPHLEEGLDILYIGFSSALSGTYNSSVIARDELSEKYPDRKIITIDSLSASMGQGLLLTYASNLRKEGKSIEEVAEWVESNKTKLCHLFTVGDLNHLKRGGRLSYAKAFLGTILKIKPLLHVNMEGKLVQTGAARGRKTALKKMVERMQDTIQNPEEQVIYISHGDCNDEVNYLKELIFESVKVKDIVVNFIGPVIGSHSGLGTIAIFYLGTDRTDPYKK